MYMTLFLDKNVTQTSQSKFRAMLFLEIYLCRLRLKQGSETQDFLFWGRELEKDAPAKDIPVLNKSRLGLGT